MSKKENISKEKRELLRAQKILNDVYMERKHGKKENNDSETVERIQENRGVDGNAFWEVRKKIMGKKTEGRPAIKDENGEIKREENDIKEVYARYFSKLLGDNVPERGRKTRNMD